MTTCHQVELTTTFRLAVPTHNIQRTWHSADFTLLLLQTTVGTLLNFGTHGVGRDHVAAAHYLQRAAAAGSEEAMAHLGHMYGAGEAVQYTVHESLSSAL